MLVPPSHIPKQIQHSNISIMPNSEQTKLKLGSIILEH